MNTVAAQPWRVADSLRNLQNVFVLVALLLVPYWILGWAPVSEPIRGRVSVAMVFAFAGLGHFLQTAEMAQMLPGRVPFRVPLICLTGAFELLACGGVFIPSVSRMTGVALCLFLALALLANISAARRRVDFGGHGGGPAYLIVRVPLQLILIAWVYRFVISP